jgi:hypothetical protein
MGPLVYGRRFRSFTVLEAPPVNDQPIFISDNLEEGDVAAIQIENRKRLMAGIVWKALETTIAAERSHDEEKLSNIRQSGRVGNIMEAMAAGFDLNPEGWADGLAEGSIHTEEFSVVETPKSLPSSQRSQNSSSTTDEYWLSILCISSFRNILFSDTSTA